MTCGIEECAPQVAAIRALGVDLPMLHLENSESLLADCIPDAEFKALLRGNPSGVDTVGYARCGGGMYGQRNHGFLRPAITLKAQVRHVHIGEAGVPVGYDRSWTAPEDSVIATVAIGFADGYMRENSNALNCRYGKGGSVYINGQQCTIAGKVCMDMIMVNCGPGSSVEGCGIQVGDYAVMYGEGGCPLAEHATNLDTAQSDVTCSLTRRVCKKYVYAPREMPSLRKSPSWRLS